MGTGFNLFCADNQLELDRWPESSFSYITTVRDTLSDIDRVQLHEKLTEYGQ